jgi:very-short-patch-repair endonuclease
MIFKFANDKYEFQCKTCDHSFSGLICSISNGTWCPYCCIPQQKLCKNDKCIWCWNTSFANYEKSRFLADKTINPRMIINGSETYHKFICENNHEFNTVIKNVTKGHWCGICKNKTETKLYQFLVENISANCQTQIKFDWCKIKRRLPFDFYIQKLKILIELDGDQHFIQVAQWKTPEEVLERDIIKMKLAIKNGLSMIRITQDDVWYDKNNWQERILDAIKTVNEYDQVIIYLENKKDYKLHQKAMREIDILQLTI